MRNFFQTNREPVREDVVEASFHHTPLNSPSTNRNPDMQKRPTNSSKPIIDYDHISRIVENTVTKMVQNVNLTSSAAEKGNNHSQSLIFPVIPYHKRWEHYIKRRNAIFEASALNMSQRSKPKRSTLRLRQYFKGNLLQSFICQQL